MAHITFHFAVGITTGTICLLPWLFLMFPTKRNKANFIGKWIIICYSFGLWAIIPNILRRLGVSEEICSGWWMNLFFMHYAINILKTGGMLIGEIIITVCFFLQYVALLSTLMIVRKDTARNQIPPMQTP